MDDKQRSEEDEYGRYARIPQEIPKKRCLDISKRVLQQTGEANLDIVGAGIPYYAFY